MWISQLFIFKGVGGEEDTSLLHSKKGQNIGVSKDGEMCLEPKNKKTPTLPTRALLSSSFVYCYLPKSKQHKAIGWVRAYSGAPRTACTVCWVQCVDFWLLWQTAKILLAFQCQKVGYLEVKRACVLIRK